MPQALIAQFQRKHMSTEEQVSRAAASVNALAQIVDALAETSKRTSASKH
jgi:hypothetical protein